jgi:lipopolysaccharide export system protein LptC
MIFRPTSWLPLAVLALLVGLTLWLNTLVTAPNARADGSLRHDPDLMVENFDARKLAEDGSVQYTLVAKKMVHYPDDDSALLESVTLEAFEPQQPKMTITADHGRLEQGGDRVWIEGNVVIIREADARTEKARVTTDKLLVLPDEGKASTTSEVHLEMPSLRADSLGVEIDNRDRTLEANRVHAIYKAPRR